MSVGSSKRILREAFNRNLLHGSPPRSSADQTPGFPSVHRRHGRRFGFRTSASASRLLPPAQRFEHGASLLAKNLPSRASYLALYQVFQASNTSDRCQREVQPPSRPAGLELLGDPREGLGVRPGLGISKPFFKRLNGPLQLRTALLHSPHGSPYTAVVPIA